MNSNTNDMECPRCESKIEIEYDEELHSVEGTCAHAQAWRNNTLENKYEYDARIWQWIEDYWAGRAEDASESFGDRD